MDNLRPCIRSAYRRAYRFLKMDLVGSPFLPFLWLSGFLIPTRSFLLFLPGVNILIIIASYHIILISIIFSLSCMFVSCIEHLSSLAKS